MKILIECEPADIITFFQSLMQERKDIPSIKICTNEAKGEIKNFDDKPLYDLSSISKKLFTDSPA